MKSSKEFACRFPGCSASYRRKEHLSRHEAQHIQQQSFTCSICGRSFGRNDTLRRHLRRKHGVSEPIHRVRKACANCRSIKSRCDGGSPCSECLRRKIHCPLIRPDGATGGDSPGQSPSQSIPFPAKPYGPEKSRHFLELYFELLHPHWPFVHRGSFNANNESPLLVQSMIVIGLWASEEQSAQSAAIDLHKTLDSSIRQQKEKWDVSIAEVAYSSGSWPIPLYQALLNHIIFCIMHKRRPSLGLDLKPSLPSGDLELLVSLVQSCRRLGMFYFPNVLARFLPDDHAPYVWVSVEEVKRFNLALFKVCRALSGYSRQDGNGKECGVIGATSWRLAASDLQFPMPKNDPLWNAFGREEWVSAVTEDVLHTSLDDIKEGEWISNSAELLRFAGA